MKKLPKHTYTFVNGRICMDGIPMSTSDIISALEKGERDAQASLDYANIVHDLVVTNQAAYIEWHRGKGIEAGMQWIVNSLVGPGQLPDDDEPYADNAQFYYAANKHDPFPTCACGNPSSQLWMGIGACSDACMSKAKDKRLEQSDG